MSFPSIDSVIWKFPVWNKKILARYGSLLQKTEFFPSEIAFSLCSMAKGSQRKTGSVCFPYKNTAKSPLSVILRCLQWENSVHDMARSSLRANRRRPHQSSASPSSLIPIAPVRYRISGISAARLKTSPHRIRINFRISFFFFFSLCISFINSYKIKFGSGCCSCA